MGRIQLNHLTKPLPVNKMKVSEKILVILYLTICILVLADKFDCFGLRVIGNESEMTPSKGRNLRAEARYHFMKANDAMDKMFAAEENNDVEEYAKWLSEMRKEDIRLIEASDRYEKLRDYLEARIWQGKMNIENFKMLYEKSTFDSILDHLTFRAE